MTVELFFFPPTLPDMFFCPDKSGMPPPEGFPLIVMLNLFQHPLPGETIG